MAVRAGAIKPEDVVECDVKGRVFFAVVKTKPVREPGLGLTLDVEPINRGITFRHIRGRDVRNHYRKAAR